MADEHQTAHKDDDARSHMSGRSAGSSFHDLERYKNMQMTIEMITESSMDPVVVIDATGQIKSCNQEFQKLLGFQRWELIGQNIIIIMPEQIRKFHDGFLKRYVKSKMKRIIGEMRTGVVAIKKDGSEIPVVLKVSELSSGTDIAFIAIVKNVTFEEELFRIKKMLSNMLPPSVTAKIQSGEKEIAETLLGSVIFIDIVGFTDFIKSHDSKTVIKELNQIFNDIDLICDKTKCEKVKTIGDCYMAICTCKNNNVDTFDYAIRIVQLGIQVLNHITKNAVNGRYHSIVVGIATGPLIQGLIYGKKLSYEVWGETCAKAGELLNIATPNRIMVCGQTFKESNFKFRYIQKKDGYELQMN